MSIIGRAAAWVEGLALRVLREVIWCYAPKGAPPVVASSQLIRTFTRLMLTLFRSVLFALVMGVLCLASLPAAAVTPAEIEAARRERAALQQRLDQAVAAYEKAEARLEVTQAAAAKLQFELARAQVELKEAQEVISVRANLSYRAGPVGLIQVLFSSSGLGEFSRRLMFLERASGSDGEALIRASRARAEIADLKEAIAARKSQEVETARSLAALTESLTSQFERARALEAKLLADREEELRRQREAARRAALAAAAARRAAFSPGRFVCPVDGPNSFRDSWGEPRSGGRRHQGVDIYAARGTPVAAVVEGTVLKLHRSSLGGIGLYLRGRDGTEYYYAHLAGYAGVSEGQSVSAGAHVAYVGNSGNASGGPAHLHFEIHPGGGAAINPYPTVRAACG